MLKLKKKNRRAWLSVAIGLVALIALDRFYAFNLPPHFIYEQHHKADKDKQQPYRTNSLILAGVTEFEEFLETHEKLLMVLATGAIAWFTATLWRATAGMFIITRGQAKDMKESIAESARAANAMENVAEATKENAVRMQGVMHRQMRAYVSVDTGIPTCQDANLRFGAAPGVQNTGFTPARNVSHKVKVAVLNLQDLNDNYKFDESAELIQHDNVLSPRQSFVINAVAPERVPDDQVEEIMRGETKRLFVWGTVTYDDIFGDSWETNFCHDFIFYREKDKDGVSRVKFLPYYWRRHNSAT